MTKQLLCLISAGGGGLDERRSRYMIQAISREGVAQVSFYIADRQKGRRAVAAEIGNLLRERVDLVYLEGTGIASGWPLLQAGRKGQKYLVSTGDPVSGFFKTTAGPLQGRAFGVYERLLMRHCAAFVGWTPYLTGRALELGAPRGITIEGGVDLNLFHAPSATEKWAARERFGIPQNHIVCVVIGSLDWSKRQSYVYGLELVELLRFLKRDDVTMLIVGDGTGKAILESRLTPETRKQVILTGRLPHSDVAQALHASDIGFVTQTIDGLGNYRLTTKLPEYLASGLGIAMSPIPGFYDYVFDAGWALPALHPGSTEFHRGCALWLDGLSREDIAQKSSRAVQLAKERFNAEDLARRFSRFVQDIW